MYWNAEAISKAWLKQFCDWDLKPFVVPRYPVILRHKIHKISKKSWDKIEQNPHCDKIDRLWQEKRMLINCSLKDASGDHHSDDEAAFSATWSVLLMRL